jgi:phosphoserine phosphatase
MPHPCDELPVARARWPVEWSWSIRRLKRVAAVVFDCDSTLSAVEGIDELGAGRRAEIEELTSAAMRGDVTLEAVYGRRLELIRPTAGQLQDLARQYVAALVPDAAAVVRALQAEGIDVRIMSGGLRPAVEAVADAVGVARTRVSAVDIRFDADGEYAGYDTRSPMARSGGKAELLRLWRGDIAGAVMMVGDGVTDLETQHVADIFVAYAGVVSRDAVVAAADFVVRSSSLAPVLPLALAGEPPRMSAGRELYEKGLNLLERDYRAFFPYFNNTSDD